MYRTFGQVRTDEDSKAKKWTEGIWHYYHYNPSYDKLTEILNEITSYCNRKQFGIKAIVPLTSATAHEYGQNIEYRTGIFNGANVVTTTGISYGWGFSNVIGFAALLERVENISEEEYQRRISEASSEPSLVPA